MRREIESAIELNRNIVPVMLDQFSFDSRGAASQLTGYYVITPLTETSDTARLTATR